MQKLDTYRAASALGTAAVVAGSLVLGAGPAMADHGITTTANVNLRTGPGTQYPSVGIVPRGTSPAYQCWTRGQSVAGVSVWFKVVHGGQTGYISSYYDDSHYPRAEDIQRLYGIPSCDTQPPTTPTPATSGAAAGAIDWARRQLGSTSWNGLCLSFVRNAWASQGVDLRSKVSVTWGSDTYPADVWGHFRSGTTGTGTPPAGALVFYLSTRGRTYSHVTIATDGGGNTISTNDTVDRTKVHTESISQHDGSGAYSRYVGWWLPA